METNGYTIKIEGGGLTLEREVAKPVGEKIVMLLLTGDEAFLTPPSSVVPPPTPQDDQTASNVGSTASVPPAPAGTASDGEPALSIREFLNEHEPKRSPDKIAAIGVYLKDHDGMDVFSASDLKKAFEDAAERIPGNLSRDISWVVKASWIAPKLGAKGKYYVTHSGREAVTKKFPPEIVKKTTVDSKSKRSTKKAG